jgi:hypothetical protein
MTRSHFLATAIDADIADLADSFGEDHDELAAMVERQLERDPTAPGLDPPNPLCWRAVIAALRRRGAS